MLCLIYFIGEAVEKIIKAAKGNDLNQKENKQTDAKSKQEE